MRDEIVCKTVPLPIASGPEDISATWTADEIRDHEARVQAHMARVHPKVDAIREEEASVRRASGDPAERALCNNRRRKRKLRTLARKRAAEIAGRKGTSIQPRSPK